MPWIWLTLFLALLVIEFATVGLVSIWFAFGAIVALLVSFITKSVVIQLSVFAISSIVALLVTKPLVKKFKITEIEPTNLDRVIGKVGQVTKEIAPLEYGEVKVLGNFWTACSNEKIPVDANVIVEKIDGSKLIVKKEVK